MNTPKYRIASIICYFGKLPWYFDYFVHSCRYNSTVDFLIITDAIYDKPVPPNLKLIRKTMDEISSTATHKLGFEVNIKHAYKLCDFKPAYGFLFDDMLKNYDYWVLGDIDVIFGNIRNFLTDELLDNYDLISVRPDWIPGCFLAFKNVDKMNTLFMHSKDYKKVFTSHIHYCFDETNFAHDAFTDGLTYEEVSTEIESMMHVIKKLEAQKYIKPHFDLFIIEGIPGHITFDHGKLTYKNKYEILLYHLIKFKKVYEPAVSHAIPEHYFISHNQIYHA